MKARKRTEEHREGGRNVENEKKNRQREGGIETDREKQKRDAHSVHLDQDAGLALGVAEALVGVAGALLEEAAFELAGLPVLHRVLNKVLPRRAQLVPFLRTIVITWGTEPGGGQEDRNSHTHTHSRTLTHLPGVRRTRTHTHTLVHLHTHLLTLFSRWSICPLFIK